MILSGVCEEKVLDLEGGNQRVFGRYTVSEDETVVGTVNTILEEHIEEKYEDAHEEIRMMMTRNPDVKTSRCQMNE